MELHRWIGTLYRMAVDDGDDFQARSLRHAQALLPGLPLRWQASTAASAALDPRNHDRANDGGEADPPFEIVAASAGLLDAEAATLLDTVREHLVCAEAINRRWRARAPRNDDMAKARATVAGQLIEADRDFLALMHHAFPGWDGRKLPFDVTQPLDAAVPGFVFRGLWVVPKVIGEIYEVRMRRDRRTLRLSARELAIAEQVTEGFTFKEIGARLGVAPSTVSTHLYNLYAKLGIRRRAELITWLRQYRAGQ